MASGKGRSQTAGQMNGHERRQWKGLQGPGERGWNQLGKSPEKKAETPEKTGRDGLSSRCQSGVYPTPREAGRMRRLTERSKQKALLVPEVASFSVV